MRFRKQPYLCMHSTQSYTITHTDTQAYSRIPISRVRSRLSAPQLVLIVLFSPCVLCPCLCVCSCLLHAMRGWSWEQVARRRARVLRQRYEKRWKEMWDDVAGVPFYHDKVGFDRLTHSGSGGHRHAVVCIHSSHKTF